jgi:energy-converting hydrogenase Eha subunit C
MPPIAQMSRSVWWAFAAGGAAALVAAALVAAALVTPPLGAAAWQTLVGVLLLVAAFRAPGGVVRALPFLGAAGTGVVLGGVGLLAPTLEPRISLIGIGIWGVVAGAGYLAVARFARAFHVPDGGLYTIAWLGLAVGIGASTLPAFRLGASTLVPAVALAATGAISILASVRLRVLPDEAPSVLSNREARRRDRAGRRR